MRLNCVLSIKGICVVVQAKLALVKGAGCISIVNRGDLFCVAVLVAVSADVAEPQLRIKTCQHLKALSAW